MLNQVVLVGRAVATFEERGALYIVVVTKDSPKFKQQVACRFWGEAKKYGEKASADDLVIVHGEVTSRESKGRWYTELNARYLQVEESGQGLPRGRTGHREESFDQSNPDQDELGF